MSTTISDEQRAEKRAAVLCHPVLSDVPLHIEGLLENELCRDCGALAVSLVHDEAKTEYVPLCADCKAEREEKPEYADPIDERAFVREETAGMNSWLKG